jgi:hypothetical protein
MDIQNLIGIGVTLLLFLVGVIIRQGNTSRKDSNARLDAQGQKLDAATIAITRLDTTVGHLTSQVDALHTWKDELQEKTIDRLRDERDRETPAVASAMRGRRRAAGSDE